MQELNSYNSSETPAKYILHFPSLPLKRYNIFSSHNFVLRTSLISGTHTVLETAFKKKASKLAHDFVFNTDTNFQQRVIANFTYCLCISPFMWFLGHEIWVRNVVSPTFVKISSLWLIPAQCNAKLGFSVLEWGNKRATQS